MLYITRRQEAARTFTVHTSHLKRPDKPKHANRGENRANSSYAVSIGSELAKVKLSTSVLHVKKIEKNKYKPPGG